MRSEMEAFLWGAATSSHQVEGNNTLNDWWEWEMRGKVRERSGLACDHYNRFRDDFKIAREFGHTAHRFSLEWSRLEPEAGRWDAREWEHYREVLKTLREFRMEPIVTLNHFTLPRWLAKRGGWSGGDSIAYFERFAQKAAETLGEHVTYWITVNEPLVNAYMAYERGVWPPGKSNRKAMLGVIENQILAHVRAYKVMHEVARRLFSKPIMVGFAHNVARFFPCREGSPADGLATFFRHHFCNHMFIWSVLNGWIIAPTMRVRSLGSGRALDFIGMNYYMVEHVRHAKAEGLWRLFGEPCYESHHPWEWSNSLGWKVYPRGLYDLLKDFARYRVPIIITENGICAKDDGERAKFIEEHLRWVFQAKKEGVPVSGYLYWSLLDNFEWADGYGPRFGLVEVDYATQRRTVRPSARIMAERMSAHISSCNRERNSVTR